ncbi:MAG: hypothetical protein DVB31_01245 [Verrucomicrobia bacterium]|nr:MAG: hypothetical protein DVB31_01245 [Verrucomicrobiota bacterium]
MNTRLHSVLFLALALGAMGCKKTSDAAAGADESGAAAATVPQKGDPAASQALATANAALQKNDYDAVIAALIAAKQSEGMSDQQKNQYRQSVRDTTTKLLEASQTDPKAKEAYENLSRLHKGH